MESLTGAAIPAWLMRIDYGEGNYTLFWLEKATGQLMKMEERFGVQMRVKVRPGVAGGLAAAE